MSGCNEFEGVGMSEQQRFSHITVSSDDDEVVILAGAPREADEQESIIEADAGGAARTGSSVRTGAAPQLDELDEPAFASREAADFEGAEPSEAEDSSAESSDAETSSERARRGERLSEKGGAPEAPASSSEAREDEAEILDVEPMPFTQKVVIAAAAVLIIAFIVYQVFFV